MASELSNDCEDERFGVELDLKTKTQEDKHILMASLLQFRDKGKNKSILPGSQS